MRELETEAPDYTRHNIRRRSSDPFDTSDPDTEAAVDRANERERLRRANADAGALEAEIIGAMIEEVRKL